MEQSLPSFSLRKPCGAIAWLVRNFSDSPIYSVFPSAIRSLCSLYKIIDCRYRNLVFDPQNLKEKPPSNISPKLLGSSAGGRHCRITAKHVLRESQILLCAGRSHVVGTVLMTGTYHLLQNPEMRERLFGKLLTVWPDLSQPPRFEALERLPYLTAVVKKTLRLAPATPVGLARVVPPEGAPSLVYEYQARQALAKACSSCIYRRTYPCVSMNFCQSVCLGLGLPNWTSSWLHSQSDHEVVKESSGLVYCELYIGLAHLFRRFDPPHRRIEAPHSLDWKEHIFILLYWRAFARLLLSKVFPTTLHAIVFYFRP